MIKVDNSAEKRFFYLKENENEKEFIELKKNISKCIELKDYQRLDEYKENRYSLEFSVFYFYDKIEVGLSEIENTIIQNQLLSLDWYNILCGDISEIREIIEENKDILSKLNPDSNSFSQYKDIFTKLYELNLSNTSAKFKKPFFELFDDLDVCPYCNRNFINPIYKEKKIGDDNQNQAPDIEHFFPKSIYPFLSLSISNLLPSCGFCNKIKSNVDTYKINCVSPYEVKENEFEFGFTLKSNEVKDITIFSKNDYQNSEILHLESLYNNVHSEYINKIFEDVLKYPESYKKSLKKFNISENDYEKIYRNYFHEKNFNKQPLSKMTKDLHNYIIKLINRDK